MKTLTRGDFIAQNFIDSVLASSDVRSRFFISMGAMDRVFSFLDAKEVLVFQGVSKFMYKRGVERL